MSAASSSAIACSRRACSARASAAISGSSIGNELAHLRELVFVLLQLGRHLDDRHQSAVLPAELGEFPGIAEPGRVGERPLDFLGASERGRSAGRGAPGADLSRAVRLRGLLRELLAEALHTTGGVERRCLPV